MSGRAHAWGLRRAAAAAATLAAGFVLWGLTQPSAPLRHAAAQAAAAPAAHADAQRAREIRARFEQGVLMLHAKRHDDAVVALQRVLALAPHLPEAHVNLGFAWLGLAQPLRAQQAFETAIGLHAQQANAYYGLAMAHEQRGDLEPALGAMRSYLHTARADDPHRARARAALWEWEERLGRHRLKGAPPPAAAPR